MNKVLIIEDNRLTRELVIELLSEIPCEILVAEDAETGIELAKQHLPQVILMDLHLPGMSGYEACSLLKADQDTSGINILAFTASDGQEAREQAIKNGCVDLISKPIDVMTFAETVISYCAK